MATIILTAVGSAVGGPIGGAIGSLIGQQIDQTIFGPGTREGPRLQELAVSTSSYGQPISRIFGHMRVPGTIIWSTDLIESSEKTSGGKGRPSTKTYSYSSSFAVALSSEPISSVGRIWADGELLRGGAGDLKVEGNVRVYRGQGDEQADPLIAAAVGSAATAFRDCAYVVFEDLQLAEFGNRIPAMTFEVLGNQPSSVSLSDIAPSASNSGARNPLKHIDGFADQGGPLSGTLSVIDRVLPLACVTANTGLQLDTIEIEGSSVPELADRLKDPSETGKYRNRSAQTNREPQSVRYYDEARDYQPGVQRAIGLRSSGKEVMIDLPATMNANGARFLANRIAQRVRWQGEQILWLLAELDPAIKPGSVVRVPRQSGFWLVASWEWLDKGVELRLTRMAPEISNGLPSDPGSANTPVDAIAGPTVLNAFELPAENGSEPARPLMFAATSSSSSGWRGAALYVEQADGLVSLGSSDKTSALSGILINDLGASSGTHFEASSTMTIVLSVPETNIEETTIAGLAQGVNRLRIGAEVLQFARAKPISETQWELSGLLRGRGGTENASILGHAAGTPLTFIDDKLFLLDPSVVVSHSATKLAAIGLGDTNPVSTRLENPGLSRRPLAPVHPRQNSNATGDVAFAWTRRGRGQWLWEDEIETSLVEDVESYIVGFGPTSDAIATWVASLPELSIPRTELDDLVSTHGPNNLWVKQQGTFSTSPATLLAYLS